MISNPFLPRVVPTTTPPVAVVSSVTDKGRNLSTESTGSNDSTGSFKRCNLYTDEEIRKMCTDGEPHRLRKILPEYFTEDRKAYLIGWMDRKMADIEVWLKEKRNAHPKKQHALQSRYDNIVICHHYITNLGKR